jgi:protein-S-isoprenylcysteine O-methyltransferase Ste14
MTSSQVSIKRQRVPRLMEILYVPWVDKTIAVVAILPNAVELYHRYFGGNLSFPRAVLGIQVLILIVTMVFRRTPVRVTPNPWFWLLAFVATYGLLAFIAFTPNGRPLAAFFVSSTLAVVSAAILVFARLSLGRSIGFVPANRGIVSTGAYRFVRHPIYTGVFIALVSFVLRSYSPLNLALAVTLMILFMVKSVVEERVLRDDPEYAAYLRQVRWRWLPGIA